MAARQHLAYQEEPDESDSDVDHEEPDESSSDVDYEESDESGSDIDYFYEERNDYNMCQTKLEKFKSLQEMVDWEVKGDRFRFSRLLNKLVIDWEDQLPDLREFFRREEIDLLLSEDIQLYVGTDEVRPLVEFVIRTGYKDEPELDEDGKPVLQRTTPVHWACRNTKEDWDLDPNMSILFEIYDRFDVNYIDEVSGYTHFHAACMSGREDVVEKFLELGQDPNCLPQELDASSVDPPLHLALKYEHKGVFELLLRHGADPNSIKADGSTILPIILKRGDHGDYDDEWMEILFEVTDEKHQLPVNARDKLGRTPLHLAVANLLPGAVEILLDHGADVTNFVFPDYDDYDISLEQLNCHMDGAMDISASMLFIVECFEKKGYEMSRRDVVSIMKLFNHHDLFTIYHTNIESCLTNEKLANMFKQLMINPGLSFYDSIWLSPEETRKRITCKDFLRFATSNEWITRDYFHDDDGMKQLNVKMWRGFYCRWGLEFFYELINRRLPILCCKIIIEKLMYKDLMKICLAARRGSKKRAKKLKNVC